MTPQVREVYTWDHERLWRSVHAFSGSRRVADDAVTVAFAEALRLGDAIRDVTVFVWRTAFAVARTELAQRRIDPAAIADDDSPTPDTPDAADITAIHSRLEALDDGDRQLLVWRHVGGWTAEEIAPALGKPAATVRLKLRRSERRARALLTANSPTGSHDASAIERSLQRLEQRPSPDLWDDIVASADSDDLSTSPVPRRRRPLVLVAGIVAVVALVGAFVVVTDSSTPADDDPGDGAPTLPTNLTATIGVDREVTLAVRDLDTAELTGTFRLRLEETGGGTVLEYENVDVAAGDDVEFLVVEVDDEPRSRTIHATGTIGTVPLTEGAATDPFTVRIVLTDPAGESVQASGTVLLTPDT